MELKHVRVIAGLENPLSGLQMVEIHLACWSSKEGHEGLTMKAVGQPVLKGCRRFGSY